MAQGARKSQLQVTHEISVTVTPANLAQFQAGGLLGIIPRGAVVHGYHVAVTTPFNATSTAVSIGTNPGSGQIVAGVDGQTAARSEGIPLIGYATPGLDFPVYLNVQTTGPAPTAGSVTVWMDYTPAVG